MVRTRKPTEEELTSLRPFVAEIEVPKYSVGQLVRLFRKILAQPNIQLITFEAGRPVQVTYHAHPLEGDLEDRIMAEISPDQLLARVTARPLAGTEVYETLVRATCKLQEQGLEPSHLLVKDKGVAITLGMPEDTDTFLGMLVVPHEELPMDLVFVCGSASAAGSLADVQAVYSVPQ